MSGRISACARRARKWSLVAVAMAMPAAGLTFASTAMAKEPTGDFAVFKQCPRFTTGVHICLYSETVGGEVTLHKQTVPITKPIVLQGGIKINPETGAESFVGALNGETLSKVAEKVPGGLTDIVNCTEIKGSGILEDLERGSCELVFENGTTGVNAITELAKPATEIGYNEEAFELEEGAALTLPVKIRLENSLLGSECYIGSSSKPLDWALTTGKTHPDAPNTSITGKIGESIYKDGDEFIYFPENTLVNNEFSAPEASGCGGIFSFLIDPIIDAKIGLSSPDGYNTVILNNKLKEAGIKGVIGSEK